MDVAQPSSITFCYRSFILPLSLSLYLPFILISRFFHSPPKFNSINFINASIYLYSIFLQLILSVKHQNKVHHLFITVFNLNY